MTTFARLLLTLAMVLGGPPGTLSAQSADAPLPLSLSGGAYASLPLGADTSVFSLSGGARAALDYTAPRLQELSLGGQVDGLYLGTPDPGLSLSVLSAGGQATWSQKILPVLSFSAQAAGGGYFAAANQAPRNPGAATSGLGAWLAGGLGLALVLSDTLNLNLDASVRSYLGLYTGTAVSLSARWAPAGAAPFLNDTRVPEGFTPLSPVKKGVQLIGFRSEPLFPVFKNLYDSRPIGQVVVHNYDNAEASGVLVSALIADYMNGPRDLKAPVRLAGGETRVLDVPALFNDRILTVSESSKLGLTLTLKYTQTGVTVTETAVPTVDVLFRNAITWDDDRHVAAFISSRDPAAFGYVRGLVSSIRDARNKALSLNLQVAIALHEALKQHGLIYSKVATSAFNRGDKVAIDTVQFPQETLQSKTGDCSDLTVLWCSMLEAVGIETMAITTPGHIYMAFSLDLSPEQATALYGPADKFIVRDGKAWVPVETTLISETFLQAWQEGARESNPSLQANIAFYPIREAWKTFAPVVVSGAAAAPPLPNPRLLADDLNAELAQLMKAELEPRAAKLDKERQGAADPLPLTNRLGLLYARYGLYDKAAEILAPALDKAYGPAFVNLGNIRLLQQKFQPAVEVFTRRLGQNPQDAPAQAGLALAYDGLGDRAAAAAAFDKLSALDQRLAAKYQYLKAETGANGTRAAEANNLVEVLAWQD